MASMYDFEVWIGTGLGSSFTASVTDTYKVNDESYITTPEFSFEYSDWDIFNIKNVDDADTITVHGYSQWGYRVAFSIEDIVNNGYIRCYRAVNATPPYYYGGGLFSGLYAIGSGTPTPSTAFTEVDSLPYGQYGGSFHHGNLKGATKFEISSNIPIFETTAEMQNYLLTGAGLKEAVNYAPPDTSPDGEIFTITNMWTHGTWLNDTPPQVSSQPSYRNFRAKMTSGKFALYKIDGIDDGKLKMGIKNDATFYEMEYSTNGIDWHYTDEFPFEYFLRKRVNELGEFDYALTLSNTTIPIFSDDTKAQDYLDGNVDITEADNWNEISNKYPSGSKVGDLPEVETEFGQVFTRAMFSQLYLCNVGNLYEISNALFDYDVTTLTGIWEDIKKGLEMYGTDPMQVVQGLRYYPFDLSQYFTYHSSIPYVYFGAYQLQLRNGDIKKMEYLDGHIDLGTTRIDRWYNDWRDFEPYTKLSIYLPYIGMFPLDAKKYYGKDVLIRYFIDLRTGACTAALIANKVMIDTFDGIIGTEMPITLTDYSSYAQSQLNIIMRNAGLGIASEATAGNLASKVMGSAITYNENAQAVQEAARMSPLKSSLSAQTAGTYGVQAIGAAAVGSTALLGGVAVGTAMKTTFDLMKSGTAAHTKTKPASSAMINQYLPQYPFFRLEVMEIDESTWLNDLYGRPTNKSDYLCNFSGYLECEDVSLICPIATDNERQEIIDLLKSGIYITPP